MIYLMRHGQDDETYVGGWSDVSLIPKGKEEVKEAALWIKKHLDIQTILCSDVARAVESAKIVSAILDVPLAVTIHLREQNKGLLNGVPKKEAYMQYPGYKEGKITTETIFPNGESLRDLYERMKVYMEEILKMQDGTLLVTHRGVINMIYFLLHHKELNMDKTQFKVTTASIHELDVEKKMIKRIM